MYESMQELGTKLGEVTKISKGKHLQLLNLLKTDKDAFKNEMITYFVNAGQQIPIEFMKASSEELYCFVIGFQNAIIDRLI